MNDQKKDMHVLSQELLRRLQAKLSTQILEATINLEDAIVYAKKESILDFIKILKLDSELQFDFLVDITAVDWMDKKPERFEVVYHLMSLMHGFRLRIKVAVPEENPEINSIVSLWAGANFMEREVWDMFGIKFKNHPDLRRILMYDEFVGHPLKKDYPVQGKQPRVPLRSPEVRNTALDMKRDTLIKINRKKSLLDSKEHNPSCATV